MADTMLQTILQVTYDGKRLEHTVPGIIIIYFFWNHSQESNTGGKPLAVLNW